MGVQIGHGAVRYVQLHGEIKIEVMDLKASYGGPCRTGWYPHCWGGGTGRGWGGLGSHPQKMSWRPLFFGPPGLMPRLRIIQSGSSADHSA
eukprot:1161753-Pelagomonas_calceolata.AAC.3